MANDRSPSTRERLLDAALARFSRECWGGTSIRELAHDVGIRESSVYKHFASKQEIFDALLERADARLSAAAAGTGVAVDSPEAAAPDYHGISSERLEEVAQGFLDAVLHDDELVALRRLLVVNQYQDAQIGDRLRDYWIDRPLAFQTEVFRRLLASGELRPGLDPRAVALAFFGPVLLLIQLADAGDPASERRVRSLLTAHVRHFRATHLEPAPSGSQAGDLA